MSMSRKDFVLIAKVINDLRYLPYNLDKATVDRLALMLASRIGYSNPCFISARFLAACGLEDV